MPPLRHHIEDLHELVPFFLGQLGQGGQLTCSPEAMQLLMRATWPGNTEQLLEVLARGRAAPADRRDPARATCRRRCARSAGACSARWSRWSATRSCRRLRTRDGNKVQAAESLGMSRATIYRKIHEYGIVTPHA